MSLAQKVLFPQHHAGLVRRPHRTIGMQMSDNVIIGLDGGGSKSLATIISLDEPTLVLSKVRGDATNRNSEGSGLGNKNIQTCLANAITQAGIEPHQVKCVSCGMAGVDTLTDVKKQREALRCFLQRQHIPDSVPCYVYNDAIAALASATAGSPYGIAVVVGTGTITLGFSDHCSHRAAGWGPAFRDGGCGYDIGQRGLAAAAASADGRGPPSTLERDLPHACGVTSMPETMHWAYKEHHSWSQIASLAPEVIRCAAAGDEVACRLLRACAEEVASSVKAVWAQVTAQGSTPQPLVVSGGLLHDENNSIYYDMVSAELQRVLPALVILRPTRDAAEGAALLGRYYLTKDTADDVGSIWHGVIHEDNFKLFNKQELTSEIENLAFRVSLIHHVSFYDMEGTRHAAVPCVHAKVLEVHAPRIVRE